MNQGHTFYPDIETVCDDINTGGDACDGMAASNNLSDCFKYEIFEITFTAYGHLTFKSSHMTSMMSIKPVATRVNGHIGLSIAVLNGKVSWGLGGGGLLHLLQNEAFNRY